MTSKVYIPNIPFRNKPAIIGSRKRKPVDREERVDPLLREEIDHDLSKDFQVRDGVLIVAPSKQPSNSLPGPSTARRVVVVNSGDANSYRRPRPLPGLTFITRSIKVFILGTADEVQSYPCRMCNNRVFLTDSGLLRHAEIEHPSHIRLIHEDIHFINSEWKRRELHLAVKKNIRIPMMKSRRNFPIQPKSPGVYEVCHICETMVKLDTEDAFERHKQKHLTEGDSSGTSDLQCVQCDLTFMSHEAYIKHQGSHRKRSFVCRYCGSRFLTFPELKRHKSEYHEYKLGYNTQNSQRITPSSLKRPPTTSFRYPESSNVRASCDKCNLPFHKVELLIRHIFTVHQSTTFNAKISVKGLPVYGVIGKAGVINYQCCDLLFQDKLNFNHHRLSHEPTKF